MKIKGNANPGKKPLPGEIEERELSINLPDRTLWTKDENGDVIPISGDIVVIDALSSINSISKNKIVLIKDGKDAGFYKKNGQVWERISLLSHLQNITSYVDIPCTNASPLLDAEFWQPSELNASDFINADGTSGILLEGSGGYIDLVLPYMVVIGDSISEGHPALHGRLHPTGTNSYDKNYKSQAGQLSYELGRLYNLPVINQGIGGQTTSEVRTRWNRDVLALVDDNVGDGRGNKTLEFGENKPYCVYLHCGINDVFLGETEATIKNNLEFFAQSCKQHDIKLIIANIGSDSNYDQQKKDLAVAINSWLKNELEPSYKNTYIIDYLDWSSDGTGDYNNLKSGMFADTVHPNKNGYSDYANYIYNNLRMPLFLNRLYIGSRLDENAPGHFQRAIKFIFNGNLYSSISTEMIEMKLTSLIDIDTPVYRLEVLECEAVTGADYTGFSNVYTKIEAEKEIVVNGVNGGNGGNGGIVAACVVYHGVIDDSWKHFGISIDTSTTSSDGTVRVILDKKATHLTLQMVGSSDSNYNFHPTWASGVAADGTSEFVISLTRITDGVVATNLNYHNYQILAYAI